MLRGWKVMEGRLLQQSPKLNTVAFDEGFSNCAAEVAPVDTGGQRESMNQLPARDASSSARDSELLEERSGRPARRGGEALRPARQAILPSTFVWRGIASLLSAFEGTASANGGGDVAQQFHGNGSADAAASDQVDGVSRVEGVSSRSSAEEGGVVGDDCDGEEEASVAGGPERASSQEDIQLPDDLKNAVTVLECESTAPSGKALVYIIGTAHVSQESVEQVRKLVRLVRPQMVFIELCHERVMMLVPPPEEKQKVPTLAEVLTSLREKPGNAFGIVYGCLLAKVSEKMEVRPGEEFRVAYEEALVVGAEVTLGDRPVQITIKRTWARLSWWHRVRLISGLLFQSLFLPSKEDLQNLIEEMKGSDMLTAAVKDMSKTYPTLIETLVDERDRYMAATLGCVARRSHSVVAVVGKGHQEGMAKYWGTHIDVQALLEVVTPTKSSPWPSRQTWLFTGVLVISTAAFVAVRYKRSS